MAVIYVVLPLALLFAAGAVITFIWAAMHGQFDDLWTPAVRVLMDEEHARESSPDGSASDRKPMIDTGMELRDRLDFPTSATPSPPSS